MNEVIDKDKIRENEFLEWRNELTKERENILSELASHEEKVERLRARYDIYQRCGDENLRQKYSAEALKKLKEAQQEEEKFETESNQRLQEIGRLLSVLELFKGR